MLTQYYILVLLICCISSEKCRLLVYDTSDYVGCFVDSNIRLLPYMKYFGPFADNSRCILHCRDAGYMYAGTEFSTYCFCGNDPWRYTAADVDISYVMNYDCNYQCLADSTQICGGFWRLSVYTTGVKNDTFSTGLCGNRKRRYTKMGVDRKLDESKAPISSMVKSKINCAALCSENEACTGFVYSTIV